MSQRVKIAVIGATSAIAQHCARLWAAEGPADFVLVGRDARGLEVVAADLKVRGPGCEADILTTDFIDPRAIAANAAAICASGAPDIVLIAHGSLTPQTDSEADLQAAHDTLAVNGVSPALFAEAFAAPMLAAGRGTIALIGSVAGDRGRKSNYVYGAAKGMVERYAQGLTHRLAGSPVKVVLIKPGPTDTPMTAEMKAKGVKLAPVADVAKTIVAAVRAGRPEVYAPAKWRVIMLVIRHLPGVVFNKLNI